MGTLSDWMETIKQFVIKSFFIAFSIFVGNFWLGFVYMEYKSHYDNISLSPATWRSITTLKEVNISFSDQNEYNFAYKSYDSINDDTKSTRNYRYICELERWKLASTFPFKVFSHEKRAIMATVN